jgi:hypothetical protein
LADAVSRKGPRCSHIFDCSRNLQGYGERYEDNWDMSCIARIGEVLVYCLCNVCNIIQPPPCASLPPGSPSHRQTGLTNSPCTICNAVHSNNQVPAGCVWLWHMAMPSFLNAPPHAHQQHQATAGEWLAASKEPQSSHLGGDGACVNVFFDCNLYD